MPDKDIDIREQIALKMGLCKCDEAYTKRGLVAPDCPYHSMAVTEAMDEYMKECCLELLEYMAANNVTCITGKKSGDRLFLFRSEWLTKDQLFENFL